MGSVIVYPAAPAGTWPPPCARAGGQDESCGVVFRPRRAQRRSRGATVGSIAVYFAGLATLADVSSTVEGAIVAVAAYLVARFLSER